MDAPLTGGSWAARLIGAFRQGHITGEELWCLVLGGHDRPDPRQFVDQVLTTYEQVIEDLETAPEIVILDDEAA